MKFYKGIKDDNVADYELFRSEFERLKTLANEQKVEDKVQLSDFCEYIAKINAKSNRNFYLCLNCVIQASCVPFFSE